MRAHATGGLGIGSGLADVVRLDAIAEPSPWLAATTKRDQSPEPTATRTRIPRRIRLVMAGRTGLEPADSDDKSPES
jgi:hypothetical protein